MHEGVKLVEHCITKTGAPLHSYRTLPIGVQTILQKVAPLVYDLGRDSNPPIILISNKVKLDLGILPCNKSLVLLVPNVLDTTDTLQWKACAYL